MRKVVLVSSLLFLLTVGVSQLFAYLLNPPASLLLSFVGGVIIGLFGTPLLIDAWEARNA